jgi:hypothetical protein
MRIVAADHDALSSSRGIGQPVRRRSAVLVTVDANGTENRLIPELVAI